MISDVVDDVFDQWLKITNSMSFSMSLKTKPSECSAMNSSSFDSNLNPRFFRIVSIISRVSSLKSLFISQPR